ncbi:hypothetical protein L484_019153 [Morus notabilis]|uniref:Uncharacterized protein n=1 Tax=Morus notabilis TaxID=981085 RepID=W9RGQ8_9ROSA|nr:hypothetical protein L484_019153 [Morus notabilis]
MSDDGDNNLFRAVGGTEYSWCRAVPGGTGITVLALLVSKQPDIEILQNALRALQASHPILNTKLHFNPATKTFSFLSYGPTPNLRIQLFDLQSTAEILRAKNDDGEAVSPLYCLSEAERALALRLHTAACDRTAAAALLRGLVKELGGGGVGEGGAEQGFEGSGEGSLGIEEIIPKGKADKPFWARGVDVLGYSLNAFRLSNLEFRDAVSPRSSRVVRLQINRRDTERLLEGCKSREIKLCGALAAAGLIAARSSKNLPDHQREKYGVVTLTNCRSILEPPLSSQHLGFYHSAILNTHDITGGETLWELATRTYMAFANAKENNKHFTDMSDLNYLMCKAIDTPGLTPSSSLRTAFISVFEDPVVNQTDELHKDLCLEDYIGCASVHGVGPSIAVFDTIRDGSLDSALVYPSPLHSREQIQELIDHMKRVLIDGCANVENES